MSLYNLVATTVVVPTRLPVTTVKKITKTMEVASTQSKERAATNACMTSSHLF